MMGAEGVLTAEWMNGDLGCALNVALRNAQQGSALMRG